MDQPLRTGSGMVPGAQRDHVAALVADALGGEQRTDRARELLRSRPAIVVRSGDTPVAVALGHHEASAFILDAIAVIPARRGEGLGRRLIDELALITDAGTIQAETDEDGVGFYRRCGFSITSLGEKYPGVERFLCMRQVAQEPL